MRNSNFRLACAVALAAALLPSLAWPLEATPRGATAAAGTVEIAFSPWDDAEGALLRVIREARKEIYVQAFIFTSRTLGRALIEAKGRGVRVEVLADSEMIEKGGSSQIPLLASAGIPVALEKRYNAAHNKIILADPHTAYSAVATGSYNFTYSAKTRNAENIVIMRGNPGVARIYFDNWQRHRNDAQPYTASALRPLDAGVQRHQKPVH